MGQSVKLLAHAFDGSNPSLWTKAQMKNVIITCANSKSGDFLIKHWLKSLKDNVSLKNIDVVVIDYGLSNKQKTRLKNQKVIVEEGTKEYHIVNKRFFDAGEYLTKNKYDQVLFVDGGDIIFQQDISKSFNKNKDSFRVVPIGVDVLFFEWYIAMYGNFASDVKKKIWRVVKNRPVINAGVIFAPAKKFIILSGYMKKLIKNKSAFGPDQIILNYYLYHKNQFKFLDEKYNFMMSTVKDGFYIKRGVFYKNNGENIVIVHNAGAMDFFRPVEDFGYGPKFNKLKDFIYQAKKKHYEIISLYKKIFRS